MEIETTDTKTKLPRQKILVIDDEEEIRNIITIALASAGYEIVQAQNGLDGLAAVKMDSPDLILCDIKMPKMNGSTLLGSLQEEPEFAGIPFIFLTGNSSIDDIRKGMQLGADDYLTKPFTAQNLIAAVETRLAKKKSTQKYYESQFDDIKSNIISSLPHEYRTPLSIIFGYAQILKEESNMPSEEVNEIGALIEKSGERLHHLLENMILYGQMQVWIHGQNKPEEMRCKSTTLIDVIQNVIDKLIAIHARPNAIHTSLKESSVRISSLYLTKIMDEIIDNAMKFSSPGSNVHLSSEETASEVRIMVRDEGRGMSEEQIKKVSGFQQFDRGYYEQQGAGLGLIIAKMLAEIHGGSLSIVSLENKGTTVSLSLPKSQNG